MSKKIFTWYGVTLGLIGFVSWLTFMVLVELGFLYSSIVEGKGSNHIKIIIDILVFMGIKEAIGEENTCSTTCHSCNLQKIKQFDFFVNFWVEGCEHSKDNVH